VSSLGPDGAFTAVEHVLVYLGVLFIEEVSGNDGCLEAKCSFGISQARVNFLVNFEI